MSLLGIDVGTSGCKAAVFSSEGSLLASAYEEYDVRRPQPGWAELDSGEVWGKIKRTIARAAAATTADPVRALAVASLGEAVVPVAADGQILGPSILNFDVRGEEYLPALGLMLGQERLYDLTGNTLGNQYGVTKLMWLRDHAPTLYVAADRLLLWGSLVVRLLGGEPVVDYSLANRTLLFDVDRAAWSPELATATGLEMSKLPATAPAGTMIGTISACMAEELGLPRRVRIVVGAHDQCANAVGAGATREGRAMYGMGTYLCIVAPFACRHEANTMMALGLNTEHHAVPGLFVTFLYNHGGSLLKWYRNTFAGAEYRQAQTQGRSIYPELLEEMPQGPSGLLVLPHFATTGPPEFISDSSGAIVGLTLETPRGTIAKGILEGVTYYLRACVESLPPTGVTIHDYCAVGGGSQSDAWVQLCADVLNTPFVRPQITEAGTLGAAIIAGAGVGEFDSIAQGADAMVRVERIFEPRSQQVACYDRWFEQYSRFWPLVSGFVRELVRNQNGMCAGTGWR